MRQPEQRQQLSARAGASRRGTPPIICGSTTFSRAVNSASRWWN